MKLDDHQLAKMKQDASQLSENAESATLHELMDWVHAANVQIDELESHTKALKKKREEIERNDLPKALQTLQVRGITREDGMEAKIGQKAFGTLSKVKDQDEAVAYLEAEGFTDGVQTVLTISYSENEREWLADNLPAIMAAANKNDIVVERKINPATLRAFVLERTRKTELGPFDADRVGVQIITQATVKGIDT